MVLVFLFFNQPKIQCVALTAHFFYQFKSPQIWRFSFKMYANKSGKNEKN